MSEKVGGVYYETTLDTSGLISGQREVDRRLDGIGKSGDRLQAKFTAISTAITAAIAAIGVEALASQIVTVQRRFDVMFASLKTVTGGANAAGDAFERIRKFAAETPYTLDQAVNGFVKLKALGLDPSERAMTSFGNTAAAMGKDLTQMIEAVADASTGEFERLKEFGIKASKEGERITFTFRGAKTEVENSASAITEYLTKIGEVDFAGAMSERMKTLDGDLSNLSDSWEAFVLSVSQSGVGEAVARSVKLATEAIQEATASVKGGELTAYFDTLRAILPAVEVAAMSLAGVLASRLIVALVAAGTQAYATAAAMGAAAAATRLFSLAASAMGGPIGIAITALGLLALNWDTVSGRAKTAAEITEDSAARIQRALSRAAGQQTAALKTTRQELDAELRDAKKGLMNLKVGTYGLGTPSQIAEGEARVNALKDQIAKIDNILGGSSTAGAGRGSVNRDFTPGPTTIEDWSPPSKLKPTSAAGSGSAKSKGQPFDATGYLSTLEAQTADAYTRIGIIEEEAKRKADDLLKEKKISVEQHAQAVKLIEANAAQDRQELAFREATENLRAIEQGGIAEVGARRRIKEMVDGIYIEAMSPAERVRLEEAEKLAALQDAFEQELLSRQQFEEAKATLQSVTNDRLQQLRDQDVQSQMALQSQSANMLSGMMGDFYDILAAGGKKRTALAKTLFLAQKALAVAEIIINTELAASKAGAQLGIFGLPMAQIIRATGYASAGMVAGMAIADVAGGRQYGGPVSANSLYRVNETGRPEMFTAANGSQYMMPTASGRVTSADKVGGGGTVLQVNVTNNHPTAQVTATRNSSGGVDVAVQEIARQIRDNSGPVWSALRGSSNVQGRLG